MASHKIRAVNVIVVAARPFTNAQLTFQSKMRTNLIIIIVAVLIHIYCLFTTPANLSALLLAQLFAKATTKRTWLCDLFGIL